MGGVPAERMVGVALGHVADGQKRLRRGARGPVRVSVQCSAQPGRVHVRQAAQQQYPVSQCGCCTVRGCQGANTRQGSGKRSGDRGLLLGTSERLLGASEQPVRDDPLDGQDGPEVRRGLEEAQDVCVPTC